MFTKGPFLLLLLISTALAYPDTEDYNYYDNVDEEGVEEPSEPAPDFAMATTQRITVEEGETAIIPCRLTGPTSYALMIKKAKGSGKKEIPLFVDSTKIPRIPMYTRYTYEEGNMRIMSVRKSDAGTYICRLETGEGVEVHHTLDVVYPAKLLNHSSSIQRVLKGGQVRLECTATGNPEALITWRREEGRLPSGAVSEQGYSMTLQEVDRHVEGVYTCTAENGIGEPSVARMEVIVEYAPEIITEKAIVRTGEGDTVELVCIVHARPAAEVVWSKDGRPLDLTTKEMETERGHRHALTIPEVSETNFGSYECTASNKLGSSNATVHLSGHPKPPHITSAHTGRLSTSYTISWESDSYYPILEYRLHYTKAKVNSSIEALMGWKKESFEVEQPETNSFHHSFNHTIEGLEPGSEYIGALEVRNRFKWSAPTEFSFSTKKAEPDQQPLNNAPSSEGMVCLLLSLLTALLIST